MKTKLFDDLRVEEFCDLFAHAYGRNRIPKPPWDDDNIITKDDYFKIIKSCAESDITKAAKGFWSKRPGSERNKLKKSKRRNKGLKQVGFTMDRKQYEAVLEAGGSDSFSTIARDAMNLYIASKQVP